MYEKVLVTLEIETGSAAVSNGKDVLNLINKYVCSSEFDYALVTEKSDSGWVKDRNGNTVGVWTVNIKKSKPTYL